MAGVFSAGEFKVTISDPYPYWVKVTYRDELMFSLHHDELPDLEYVIARATAMIPAKHKDG